MLTCNVSIVLITYTKSLQGVDGDNNSNIAVHKIHDVIAQLCRTCGVWLYLETHSGRDDFTMIASRTVPGGFTSLRFVD